MRKLSSKERVLTTFARQIPDQVPINYEANPGIDARLKSHFGLAPADHEGLRQRLGVDFRCVLPAYIGPKLHADQPGLTVDNWGIRRRWVEHATGGYWDYCDWPLENATLTEIENWPLPSPDHFDYAALPAICRAFQDYAVVTGGPGVGDIINSTGMLRTMAQVLIDLATDEPAGLRLIDRRIAIWEEIMRRTLEAAHGLIDVLWIGEDLGTQRGPTISLDLFRTHIRPRLQKFVDLAKAADRQVMVHSCGSSSWAFADFAAMGVTVVDTLQPEAQAMAPADLKQRYGDRLAFHGMISTAGPVATGTVAEVVQNCQETLEIMMPGGGYAFAPTHALQDNSPTENVIAMYDTVRRAGHY